MPDNQASLAEAVARFRAPSAASMPMGEVLKTWKAVEPQRYPLKFGGFGWGVEPDDHHSSLTFEFGAAIDALAQRGWSFLLEARSGEVAAATVQFAAGCVSTAEDSHLMGVLVRAAVTALGAQRTKPRPGLPLVLAVTLTGTPATDETGVPSTTLPTEDLRVWSRLEPHRFDKGASHFTSPLYRGIGENVLASAHRAMVVLQYVTVGPVIESAHLHGWHSELLGRPGNQQATRYTARITLPDGRSVTRGYPTPGPACLKAYLAALNLHHGNTLNLTPTRRTGS